MLDVIFVVLTVALFVVNVFFAYGCDLLGRTTR